MNTLINDVNEDVDRDSLTNQTNLELMKEHCTVNYMPSPINLLQNNTDKNEIRFMHIMSERDDTLTHEKRVDVAVLLLSGLCDDSECDDDDTEGIMTDKRTLTITVHFLSVITDEHVLL